MPSLAMPVWTKHIAGEVKKISPEAPVPVVEVTGESSEGLSCNVAANVVSLKADGTYCVVGKDRASDQVSSLLQEQGVSAQRLIVDQGRPTTRKTRIMAEHQQVVSAVDHEKKQFIDATLEDKVLQQLEAVLDDCQGVILEDYAKGVLSHRVCQEVIQLARRQGKPVLVDPSRTTPLSFYKGAQLIKPNRDEAVLLSGFPSDEIHRSEKFY
ncbi:MAG: PfkB family carbohydrate kinase [Bdellovibrionales bacterium]